MARLTLVLLACVAAAAAQVSQPLGPLRAFCSRSKTCSARASSSKLAQDARRASKSAPTLRARRPPRPRCSLHSPPLRVALA